MALCGSINRGSPLFTFEHILSYFLLLSSVIYVHAQPYYAPPPTFAGDRQLTILENAPIGEHVITPTIDANEKIKYSLSSSAFKDGSSYFQVDPDTGKITLKKSLMGMGGEDLYFILVAAGKYNVKVEFRISVKSTSTLAKDTSNIFGENGNSNPSMPKSPPVAKPNSTSFTSPPPSTTRRPKVKKPTPDPLNNPKRLNTSAQFSGTSDPFYPDLESPQSKPDFEGTFLSQSQQISIAGVLIVSFFIFVAWAICKCQRKMPTRSVIKTFSHKIVNNNKSDNSIGTTSSSFSEIDYNGPPFRARSSKEMSSLSDKSFLKVSESEWEFPRHHLKFIHILGEGCFGQVWKCEAVNIGNTGCGSQVVAVKTLKQNANQKEKDDLLEELEVMKMLEPHANVVTLIGCCAEQDPVLLIMEFIPNGTLQNYLRESRTEFGDHGHSRLTSRDLISFAYQIAKGMEYLASKGVIHRDLAARNVLVGFNKVCKISDFGFAKYDNVYERKSEGRLPIRWMAVESLTDFIFTSKSDVWSFGILMWEIVTLGWTPYPGFAAAEVIKKVCEGYRLEKPEHCKREMFNIMYYCWDKDAIKRPSFSELVKMLDSILYSENDYIELDRFPDHAYYNILKPGTTGEKL